MVVSGRKVPADLIEIRRWAEQQLLGQAKSGRCHAKNDQ
jgi:hypothetical protein